MLVAPKSSLNAVDSNCDAAITFGKTEQSKGSHQKKKYEILDIGRGGVSAAAKLFIDERYGHVYRGGGGGWSSSSKLVFCIKVCFVGT